MNCPACDHPQTEVVDTRKIEGAECQVIRRRRRCPVCAEKFWTYERVMTERWDPLERKKAGA